MSETLSQMGMKTLILSLIWILLPLLISAQSQPVSRDTLSDDVIIIDHVGKLIEDLQGLETIKWLSKGLQLRIDSTNIYADSAVIFNDERVFAYGDVVIQQGDSLHVFTDTLKYYRDKDVAHLIGEVALQQGSRQLWTTNLTYFLGDRYGEYNNGGVLVDGALQVSSKRGTYWAAREEVMFHDSVIVLHPKFNLAADSLRYLASQSLVLFTGPTNIFTKAAKIYTEGGYYDLKTETAEFNLNPKYTGNRKNATADTIRYMAQEGEVEMMGNVIVIEEDKTINGDYLRYLENSGETWILGQPAKYIDSTRKIISPEIFYNEKTNQVTTKGASEIRDGPFIMKAEQTNYDQLTGRMKAEGNVVWRDTVQNIGIFTEQLDYGVKTSYMLAYGTIRPIFFTIIEEDTLYIAADTFNMWTAHDTLTSNDTLLIIDSINMMRAYHDVRLFKSDMQGKADSMVFHSRDSLFTFYGTPVMWSDTTQFSADTINMHMENKQIKDIVLNRRAMIVSELMNFYYDQIKGKKIVAQFDSSAIEEMVVTGNAESIYYTRDDNSAFIGVNKTICSKMFFTFNNGEIHLLKYYGDNSSTLSPMHEANHDKMRLEGFLWRESERPHNVNDLLKRI